MKNENLILEYIKLDLKKVPKTLEIKDPIDIKKSEIKAEKDYKVYKQIPIKDIEILLTNSLRLDEPVKKIETINTIEYYLDSKNKEEYSSFLNCLRNTSVDEIKEIEELQEKLIQTQPAKIKYEKDYLWQIYYVKRTDKYYMLVPIQETNEQVLLYMLKKKIEKSKDKIYVPICNMDYESSLIETNKINTLENYLYYFTKNWPGIYEVHQGKKESIDIIGKIELYEGITSDYKLHFDKKENLEEFYNLIKALFDIQTEISNYFKFEIVLDENAQIHFYYNNKEITYTSLKQFYIDEINNALDQIKDIDKEQNDLDLELSRLRLEEKKLNADLLNKQRQISTFLECKKTFFGRVKYFFKHSKKKAQTEDDDLVLLQKAEVKQEENHVYYDEIEDLIYACRQLKIKKVMESSTKLDIQNLNIKIEILKKKIENASLYIQEIESHKKSIFEFWKFTNKDEKNQLTEGIVKVGSATKIEKTFNLKDDLEDFGKQMDKLQRKVLSEDEQESVLVSGTKILKDINLVLKEKPVQLEIPEEDLFVPEGKKLNHRETPRKPEKYLKLSRKLKDEEYAKLLKNVATNIENAIEKCTISVNIPLYSATLPKKEISIFNIEPKTLLKDAKTINLYKINVKQGSNGIVFSNIIVFSNRNQTLPIGMDYSDKVLLDLRNVKIKKQETKTNYIISLSEDKNKVTKINLTNIELEK